MRVAYVRRLWGTIYVDILVDFHDHWCPISALECGTERFLILVFVNEALEVVDSTPPMYISI
jgi:hypothetical protein